MGEWHIGGGKNRGGGIGWSETDLICLSSVEERFL